MKTVRSDGWRATRLAVFDRDGGCIAVNPKVFGKDTAPDPCANEFGDVIAACVPTALLEFDHVTQNGVRFDDEAHGIAACAWHHRLSQRWRTDSKSHRQAERRWLARHYPEIWSDLPPQAGVV